MNTRANIRPLTAADHARWLPLWEGYQTFYQTQLSDAITATTFARFLDANEPVFAGVAEHEGTLLGMVTCVVHRSTWSLTHYAYLEDLFVSPAARGMGVGRSLIAWVQTQARERDCSKLYWHTHETNQQAQALYNRVAHQSGFIEYQMAL
jgi:GNAT superfamily N-acetyltransferase